VCEGSVPGASDPLYKILYISTAQLVKYFPEIWQQGSEHDDWSSRTDMYDVYIYEYM